MMGCMVGRRLLIEHIRDRADIWEAVKHSRKVYAAYSRSTGAPARHPQSLSIMLPPDAMQADASSPAPDLRTQEERDQAARAAMQSLQAWLECTDKAAKLAFERHVIEERDQPVSDWSGIVMALRCVVDGTMARRIRVMRR
jgi:hypothetical protein